MKKFWISYVCYAISLPYLLVYVHHDLGVFVMTYILSLFTAVGVLVGGLRLKFVMKLLCFTLISGVIAWMMSGPPEYVDRRAEFTWFLIVLTTLMTIGCLVRAAATGSKYQSLLGFIAGMSASAVIVTMMFVHALLPEKEAKIQRARDRQSNSSDLRFNQPLPDTYPIIPNKPGVTTNALPMPKLKL